MLLETTSHELTGAQSPIQSSHCGAVWADGRRFAAFLGVLIFATFPRVLLGFQSFAFRDFGLFGYPLAFFHRESFWKGELPLWDPLNYCGLPFLAQWNTMTLYPGSLIYLVFPMPWSLSFFCLAHLFWGGLGAYLLARDWTGRGLAAALAGLVFAFNGVMLGSLIWPSQIATFAWAPWTIWLVQRAWREGGRQLLWGVLAGVMQMLAGGPETILFTWCALCLLLIVDMIQRSATRKSSLLRFLAVVMLVATVCAAQLLPFLTLVKQSQRGSGYGLETWAMPWSGWANFLVPMFETFPSKWGVYLQKYQLWLSSYYLGIGTIFLAVIGIRRATELRVRLMCALALFAAVLAMGENTQIYRTLYKILPIIGFARFPVKFVIITAVAAPVLAAFGLKALLDRGKRIGRFELWSAAAVALLIGIVLLIARNSPVEEWRLTFQSGISRSLILVAAVLLLGRLASPGAPRQALWGTLLLLLFWVDFMTHMPSQNPTISPTVYSPDWVKAGREWKNEPRLGHERAMICPQAHQGLLSNYIPDLQNNYLIERLALFLDCNLLEGIPTVQGFFPLTPQRTDIVAATPAVITNQDFAALYDFMGVSQLLGPNAMDWTARSSAMPWVTIGQQPVYGPDALAFQAFGHTNTDFRRVVFLPSEAQPRISAGEQPDARVVSTRFSNQRVEIETEAPAKTMVVISQSYHPSWNAYIDGQRSQLWRANYAFQALQVPAGRHHIDLRYEDASFRGGLILSGLGLGACILIWALPRFRKTELRVA